MWYWLWVKWIELTSLICYMNGHGEPGATPNMQGLFGRAVTRKCMELEERGCNPQNSKKQCPQIRRFLEHHLVDSSLLIKEGKKRKTKAGNMVGSSPRGQDISTSRGSKW